MAKAKRNYWFSTKGFGCGWCPVKWQAWSAVLLWITLFTGAEVIFLSRLSDGLDPSFEVMWFVPFIVGVTAAILAVAYAKGPAQSWSWGDDK